MAAGLRYPAKAMTEAENAPQRIAHYRILRPLGVGGMAKVYLAEDTKLQRQVALKLLPRHGSDLIATEARLLREARAAARLDHPNVCAIFEVGEAAEGSFIAMQYIEGETLAARMNRRRLKLGEALDIAIQLLDALTEAHDKGIVHRDIKPANIMLTSRDQVKVLDFGLATTSFPGADPALLGLTQSGMVVGTVPYMSPEQLRADPLTGRSDLFSVGTLLYEMATGQRPFQAKSGAEVMSSILRENPPLLADDHRPPSGQLPPALRRILRHALEKDPDQRFATAAGFRGELEVLRMGLVSSEDYTQSHTQGMGSDPVPRMRRSGAVERRPVLRWSLAAAAVLLVAAGALLGWRALATPRPGLDSIAVLPFSAPPGDAEADLLAEGLTDEVIRELARRPGLKVIARSSVQRYKGPNPDFRAVAKDLDVKAVLVGRLLRRGERAELVTELVDPADQRQLWSDTYRCDPADLPDLQARLLQDLTRRAGMSLPEASIPTRKRTIQPEAFELFLRGRRELERMSLESTQQAFRYFDQALRLSPNFAEIHAHKAYGYMALSHRFMRSNDAMKAMKAETQKALALDPDLPEAHTALAFAEALSTLDYRKAEAGFRRGIELAPGSAQAHELFGYFLSGMGRHAEAAKEIELAVLSDPLSARIYCVKGLTASMARDWKASEKAADQVLALDPGNSYGRTLKARIAILSKAGMDATRFLEGLPDTDQTANLYRGVAMARIGQMGSARTILQGPKGILSSASSGHAYKAIGHLAIGNRSGALDEIERMVQEKEEAILFLTVEPFFDELRPEPRFGALLRAAGYDFPRQGKMN